VEKIAFLARQVDPSQGRVSDNVRIRRHRVDIASRKE
jgi:hypothetical protein